MLKEPKIPKAQLKAHSKFIRELGICVMSGSHGVSCQWPIQSCHIRKGFFCASRKPTKRELPMCHAHHAYQHSTKVGEVRFWGDLMDKAIELCEILWWITGDREQALNFIAHFQKEVE